MGNKKRMANLELLRCLAMMMIVVLHFLGKGSLLGRLSNPEMSEVQIVAWGLEFLSLVAVNLYMLLSGYLLCESKFRLSRLVQIVLQVLFYSVLFGLLGSLLGTASEEMSIYYLLQIFLPISMNQFWFMTSYVLLYLSLPFVGTALERMPRQAHRTMMLLLLFFFSVIKTLLPVALATDTSGYDFWWYLTVFVAAAYVRKYGMELLKNRTRNLLLYFAFVAGNVLGSLITRKICFTMGKFLYVLENWTDYNHLFCFLAALFLFGYFLQIKADNGLGRLATKAGPYTLGVYLLHENVGFRYAWPQWFGAERINSPVSLLGCTLLAVAGVFLAGICVDYIRLRLFDYLHRTLLKMAWYQKLCGKITAIDRYFA